MVTKLSKIGNSQGLRIPKTLIIKYHFENGIEIEENENGLLIKPIQSNKLSWEDTYKEMKLAKENWSDWDDISEDIVE